MVGEVVLSLRRDLLDPDRYGKLCRGQEHEIRAYLSLLESALATVYGGSFDLVGAPSYENTVYVYATRPSSAPRDDAEVAEHVRKVAVDTFDAGHWRDRSGRTDSIA